MNANQMPDPEKMKAMLKETFDAVAGTYDSHALRFFTNSAQHLAGLLELQGGEQVLDVATGTGHAALAIASLLPEGHVTGIDFSPEMLGQARRKAAGLSLTNVTFQEMDMHELAAHEGQYDVAVCAFGIFFAQDMEAQLSLIASAVKPGGTVAFTGFEEDYFRPQSDLLFARLESYGVARPPDTWKKVGTESGCRDLMRQAGLTDLRVERKNQGYFLVDADEWWDIVWKAGYRRLVSQLPEDILPQFKQEHLREIEALSTKDGIWLDIGVLYALGARP